MKPWQFSVPDVIQKVNKVGIQQLLLCGNDVIVNGEIKNEVRTA